MLDSRHHIWQRRILMMRTFELTVVNVGHELGIVFPNELLRQLGVAVGDTLNLVPCPEGYRIETVDPDSGAAVTWLLTSA